MAIFRRLANLVHRSQLDREIDAELQSHIDLRTDENIARGMSPAEARREAVLRFGNPTVMRERVAAADASLGLDGLWRDLRYGLRQLRHSPGYVATAIVTLGLGIGATVVAFGVLNALVLRPLNVADADRVFQIEHKQQGYTAHSYPDYGDLRARNTAFEDIAAFRMLDVGLSAGGSAQRCWIYEVSGNYFDLLGAQPQAGRLLHASDERGPNSAPYIVLSDGFWRSHFDADPRVVGMTVEVNRHPFTILGVAPKSFNGTELFLWPDFWVSMVNQEQIDGYSYLARRSNHSLFLVGKLKPGVTPAQGSENLDAVARQMAKEHPVEDGGLDTRLVRPGLMDDGFGTAARAFLSGVMGLAVLVLLAACTNLASIVTARFSDRTRELAIRISIGSTRWRILRQLLMETLVVCLAGGLAGTVIAAILLRALSHWKPIPEYPIHVAAVADLRVYLTAFAVSLMAGILPGLVPARQIWRTDPMQALKSSTRTPGLWRRISVRDLLMGVQIALCAVLVTASLVSLRGMERTLHAPLGFQPQGVMLAEMKLQMSGYSDHASLAVQRRMIDEVSRIPGVTAVGTIDSPPLAAGGSAEPIFRNGTTDMRLQNSLMTARYYSISPGYLRAAGTSLIAGRNVSWSDDEKTPRVALVNQTFARKLFGTAPAVGQFFMDGPNSRVQIIGVMEDGKYEAITEQPSPALFFPLAQRNENMTTLVVRSSLTPADTAAAMSRVIRGIDSSLPVTLHPWMDALGLVMFPARAATAALSVMGALAALLAITGVFGMAAYAVSKRMHELGIRLALGAKRRQIAYSALARSVLVQCVGSMAGLLVGIVASRLLAVVVYEATPRDPWVIGGSILTMVLLGIVATWIPAQRAMHVNPAQLLRED